MKADFRRKLYDHIQEILLEHMPTEVAALRALRPAESLPDIKAVYINEEDYNKVVLTPCILLFAVGPVVLAGMTEAYAFEFPVDICAFDVPTNDGLPALYNRLYNYQGCLTEILLADHAFEAGYWDEVRPMEPVDPQNLADNRFGELGRVEGYRFGFQMPLQYP